VDESKITSRGHSAREFIKERRNMIFKDSKNNSITFRWLAHAIVAIYGAACLWLYYHQSIADLTVEGNIPYQSDLPLHISMAVQDHWAYSFTAYAYQLLSWICGGSTIGIALFLAVVSVLTVYATENLICLFSGKTGAIGFQGAGQKIAGMDMGEQSGKLPVSAEKTWKTLGLALSLNLVMPAYLSFVGEFRYVSYQSPNVWHNSTYLCMKLVALITIWYYFRLAEHYEKGLSTKEWVIFMLLNVLCTGIKPSFLVAFSPIMGLFLLVDLFQKKPFSKILLFGSALLPSGLVILWQNAVLFGENTGNGIGFHPWYSFSLHAAIPKLSVVCSALFCILVIAFTCFQEWRNRQYVFVLGMTALGFLEALCLVENGSRSVDGNFLWGYGFCLFLLFTLCSVKCLQMKQEKGWLGVKLTCVLAYGWHVWCGLYFFVRLVAGEGFFMR
jgi:hypothetical protein